MQDLRERCHAEDIEVDWDLAPYTPGEAESLKIAISGLLKHCRKPRTKSIVDAFFDKIQKAVHIHEHRQLTAPVRFQGKARFCEQVERELRALRKGESPRGRRPKPIDEEGSKLRWAAIAAGVVRHDDRDWLKVITGTAEHDALIRNTARTFTQGRNSSGPNHLDLVRKFVRDLTQIIEDETGRYAGASRVASPKTGGENDTIGGPAFRLIASSIRPFVAKVPGERLRKILREIRNHRKKSFASRFGPATRL